MAGKNIFNSIQVQGPKRSHIDLSHDVKLSCKMGYLVPTMAIPTVPGDSFNLGCDSLVRLPPLVSPVMHRMDVSHHYFWVPNHLLWPNWNNFITNTPVAGNVPAHPFLQIKTDGSNYTELMDYMGIPNPLNLPGVANDERIDALPFAAYQFIYNEYYRDQNLVSPVSFELADGDNSGNITGNLGEIRKRAWEHDYFTSALPFAQKGAAVGMPLTFDDVLVKRSGHGSGFTDIATDPAGDGPIGIVDEVSATFPVADTLYADTSTLSSTSTITDLRRATKLQQWLEKMARAGSRAKEFLKAIFNVNSPDARLQRPEYITGTKTPVIISEVLNTSGAFDPANPTDPASPPQGNMAGHAVSVSQGKVGNYYCYDHGWIICITSIMPKTAYMQGIPRKFLKINDPFDYFYPDFENIGEQEIENRELMAFQATSTQSATFGYIPRYSEYKFEENRVAGEFRTSLDFWHMARKFTTLPALNQSFIEADPTTRIFAVLSGTDTAYIQMLHKVSAIRPMQKYGNPYFT